jgi:hypothetical protein
MTCLIVPYSNAMNEFTEWLTFIFVLANNINAQPYVYDKTLMFYFEQLRQRDTFI